MITILIFFFITEGYKTQYCCSGHISKGFYSVYIVISGSLNGIDGPEGFTVDFKDAKTNITSKYIKKSKVKPYTQELEVLIKKNLGTLRDWVELLPNRISS